MVVRGRSRTFQELYTSGDYLQMNPAWHAEESPLKVKGVLRMLAKNRLYPRTICDVGCGVGETLRLLQERLHEECTFVGYEVSPQAYAVCAQKSNDRLQFKLADIRDEPNAHFDLLLLLDVIEHVEDYYRLLRDVQSKADYKIFNIPLDIFVGSVVLRSLINYRDAYGHIHYFTKEIALRILRDAGYEVLDHFYAENAVGTAWRDMPWSSLQRRPRLLGRKLAGKLIKESLRAPVRLLFGVHQDFAVRIFGGWKLLVLAR